ncbi:MAG: DNA polymerase I [Candidatus Shikimatogenerans bostrichidophilus]|nr:MAG: DNA polymerase I [Candidatus Shikimatogenerans bostrichidophilus]
MDKKKLINDKRFFLIDAFIYIYKYYFSLKKTFYGNYILLGFLNLIINILIKEKPTYIVVVFDCKIKNNYKKKIFKNYKIKRKKSSIKISESIPYIKKYLKLLNIPIITSKTFEADDIIGTLIKKNEKNGYINYIFTEDKDFYQFISNKTFILKKNLCIDKKFVLNKYNIVFIKQLIDVFSMTGDNTDNIPGIPYIGIKTANKLLKKYKNIEKIYLNIKKIDKKIKKKILHYKYLAFLSKKLFIINNNVKIKLINYRKKIKINKINKILFLLNKNFFKNKINKIKNIFL